jgi:hypothetical protein
MKPIYCLVRLTPKHNHEVWLLHFTDEADGDLIRACGPLNGPREADALATDDPENFHPWEEDEATLTDLWEALFSWDSPEAEWLRLWDDACPTCGLGFCVLHPDSIYFGRDLQRQGEIDRARREAASR